MEIMKRMQISCYNEVMQTSDNNDERLVGHFGQALRFYRRRAGLTQAQLAGKVGVDQTTLSGWESRAESPRDPMALLQLADVLEVDDDDLRAGRIRRSEVPVFEEEGDALLRALAQRFRGKQGDPEILVALLKAFSQLTPEEQQYQLEMLEWSVERKAKLGFKAKRRAAKEDEAPTPPEAEVN